jgi:ferredoxin-NADP reductase/ferredoxin
MTAESQPIIIKKIVAETARAKTFFVEHEDGSALIYKPGQFLHLGFPKLAGPAYRSYSFSTIPQEGAAFTVKELENGDISRAVQSLAVGAQLNFINVGGKFVLPENMDDIKQIFFFAAGSGITPIFSLIKEVLHSYPDIHIYLAYSNSSKAAAIFYEKLVQLEQAHEAHLKITFIFSDNTNLLKARLSGFRLQELVGKHRKANWEQILAYTCGPVEFMDTVKITLFTCGIKAEHFYMEYFETVSDALLIPPPDQELHKVYIHLLGADHVIPVQYPDTILSAAVNAGLKLPYSCQSGQCGSCAAKLVAGEVWLQYNEVLTPDELRSGLTLTCMGCPINGDVHLRYD